MITVGDWQEFLYSCDLIGQQWLHVDRVREAYLCWRWRPGTNAPYEGTDWHATIQRMIDGFAADPSKAEQTLDEFLSEPHYGPEGKQSVIPPETRKRIVKMLHLVVNERPNPDEPVN